MAREPESAVSPSQAFQSANLGAVASSLEPRCAASPGAAALTGRCRKAGASTHRGLQHVLEARVCAEWPQPDPGSAG